MIQKRRQDGAPGTDSVPPSVNGGAEDGTRYGDYADGDDDA